MTTHQWPLVTAVIVVGAVAYPGWKRAQPGDRPRASPRKPMFRIKAQIDPELLTKHTRSVTTSPRNGPPTGR